MAKVITAAQAAELFKDEDYIMTAGFGLSGWPEEIGRAVRDRFLKNGHPKSITHVHASGIGDWVSRGSDDWVEDGLMTANIASHQGSSPKVYKAVMDNKIKAWNLPLGTMIQLFKDMGRKGPGLYSKIGLGTFIDPRQNGGRLNQLAREDPRQLVEVRVVNGEEWMFYKHIPCQIGLMRGTTADTNGNISNEKEAINLEMLTVAQAVKAYGGIVIVQVESLTQVGSIHPKLVKVPGIYVDYIVIAEKPDDFMQTQATRYNRAFTGEIRVPLESVPQLPLDITKVMCRRTAMEIKSGYKCNFAIGTPTFTPSIITEEGCANMMTMISESGSIGGVPGAGRDFGAHWNIEASCDQGDHFSFFDGGGLDLAAFGLSEVDKRGNVNTSLLNSKLMGVGGFINVSTNAHVAIFIGTFTAGGIKASVVDGKIVIDKEGKFKKFVDTMEQITYNGDLAMERGNKVVFISERCVIERKPEGMVVTEIAPGIDLQKDVLDQMGFVPIIPEGGPKLMNPAIFQEKWGGLKSIMEANA